jgi:hypothetical protein
MPAETKDLLLSAFDTALTTNLRIDEASPG